MFQKKLTSKTLKCLVIQVSLSLMIKTQNFWGCFFEVSYIRYEKSRGRDLGVCYISVRERGIVQMNRFGAAADEHTLFSKGSLILAIKWKQCRQLLMDQYAIKKRGRGVVFKSSLFRVKTRKKWMNHMRLTLSSTWHHGITSMSLYTRTSNMLYSERRAYRAFCEHGNVTI